MMMPISARIPRIATKPIGVPVGSNAATTPISPSGATLATRRQAVGEALDLRRQPGDQVGGLDLAAQRRLHRDRRLAVAAPHQRLLQLAPGSPRCRSPRCS
ncbi:hypothetical protein RLJV_23575 [Pseudomonas aeruginosa]|nr:hypothetical protein RLJV_23575 [Pseudomonas aeruginosa]